VFVVDDDLSVRRALHRLIRSAGFSVETFATAREFLDSVPRSGTGCLVLDIHLGGISGFEVQERLAAQGVRIPVIVITAHGSMESVAEAARAEAFDYIGKPFRTTELIAMLRRALDWRAQLDGQPSKPPSAAQGITSIVGRSSAMVAIYRVIARVAATDSTVLISGESGTGKELVAHALHDNSPRAQRLFVPVNCGAFTETLLESELFGHVRGAFTGATHGHRGIFETATGGTIFLDEIAETVPAFQVKLLRVLQEKEIRPVGASGARQVDVRVIAATNRRIQDLLEAGDFRRDLLYRLGVINIELPPLRARREDIPLLVEHFLQRTNTRLRRQVLAPPATVAWLSSLAWPGNVRELENAVERAVTLNTSGQLAPEDFTQFTPIPLSDSAGPPLEGSDLTDDAQPARAAHTWLCELPRTLAEVERAHILATLRYTKGNKLRAAELLEIGRYSLYRKAERLGIDLDSLSAEPKSGA